MQQEEAKELPQNNTRRINNFNLSQTVDRWEDFKATWMNVKFTEELNHSSDEEIQYFWETHLRILVQETEKVCILVPNEVQQSGNKTSAKKQPDLTGDNYKPDTIMKTLNKSKESQPEEKEEKEKAKKEQPERKANVENVKQEQGQNVKESAIKVNQSKNKSKKNNKKQEGTKKVKLNPNIITLAIELIQKQRDKLEYQYQSLFMDKDKQLLIFRKCLNINKYLQRYRLPMNHKDMCSDVDVFAGKIYDFKIQRNIAISTMNQIQIKRINEGLKNANSGFHQQLSKFLIYLKRIIVDFKSKNSVKQIVLSGMRQQVKQHLDLFCKENDLFLKNRYIDCQSDQYKDLHIVKEQRIIDNFAEEEQLNKNKIVEYVYIQPERQLELPKPLDQIKFFKVNLIKQCYVYQLVLPKSVKYYKPEGIFIRSEEGQDAYEQNIDIQKNQTNFQVQIYPYRYGRSVYRLFTWNQVGFTKSLQKIIFFNEFDVQGKWTNSRQNYQLYLLGETKSGLLIDEKTTNQELKSVNNFTAKDFSICNSLVLCDKNGDAAGWGQMYYYDQQPQLNEITEEQNDILLQTNLNLRIEYPVLLLANKEIRKISCGIGYTLMVDMFGKAYSFGFNNFGQLGLGHFKCDDDNMGPQEIQKFAETNNPFLVDVKASFQGASFAIDHQGGLYRWGANQVEQTNRPVVNRFGDKINFSPHGFVYKSAIPFKTSQRYLNGAITTLEAGNNFYLALNASGILLGWGQCKYLGCGPLLDIQQKEVTHIVNPIEIMKNVESVTAGNTHCIVVTKDKQIKAWGYPKSFSNKHFAPEEFIRTPIDITQQYGGFKERTIIKAGKGYTLRINSDNLIQVFGGQKSFSSKSFKFNKKIIKVQCGQEDIFAILTEKEHLINTQM